MQRSRSESPSPRSCLAAAVVCIAAAGALIWAGWTRDATLRVPPAVAYAAAGVFGLAALRLVQLVTTPGSPGDGLAALLMATAAGIAAWISFGPGTRTCGVGVGVQAVARVSDLACRIPFGLGALLAALMAAYAARRWLRARAA